MSKLREFFKSVSGSAPGAKSADEVHADTAEPGFASDQPEAPKKPSYTPAKPENGKSIDKTPTNSPGWNPTDEAFSDEASGITGSASITAKRAPNKGDGKVSTPGGSGGSKQQLRTINAALRTSYRQEVSYFIQDATSLRWLVNGRKYRGGEEIWLTFDSTDGRNGSARYSRDSYPEGGGQTPPTLTLLSDGQVTNMIL